MPALYTKTLALVSSSEATGTAAISSPDASRYTTIIHTRSGGSAAVRVWGGAHASRLVPLGDAEATDGAIYVEGVYPYLEVRWTGGGGGTLTVDVVQDDPTPLALEAIV